MISLKSWLSVRNGMLGKRKILLNFSRHPYFWNSLLDSLLTFVIHESCIIKFPVRLIMYMQVDRWAVFGSQFWSCDGEMLKFSSLLIYMYMFYCQQVCTGLSQSTANRFTKAGPIFQRAAAQLIDSQYGQNTECQNISGSADIPVPSTSR